VSLKEKKEGSSISLSAKCNGHATLTKPQTDKGTWLNYFKYLGNISSYLGA